MSALIFLIIPITISAVWLSIQAFRQRKPTGVNSSVEAFRREMRALAPDDDEVRRD